MNLTEKEKLVFYGLVKWPELSDTLLSEKIGIGRSTITTIRNRLEKKKLYTTINVPDFEHIGCEILSVLYGEFHPHTRLDKEMMGEFKNIFFMMSMGMHKVSLGASSTFTEIKKHIEDYHDTHHKYGISVMKRHNYVLFPLKLCKIFRFFDYAPLLRDHFNLNVLDKESPNINFNPYKGKTHRYGISARTPSLTWREKRVFRALIEYPKLSDSEIGLKVSMTRQTVNTLRRKIEAFRLMKTKRIPDIRKLGFELLIFTHLHLNPMTPIHKRSDGIRLLLDDPTHILKISGNLESVMLSVFRDYTHYLGTHDKLFNFYRARQFLLEEPITKIFSMNEADLNIHHMYVPLVENVLMSR